MSILLLNSTWKELQSGGADKSRLIGDQQGGTNLLAEKKIEASKLILLQAWYWSISLFLMEYLVVLWNYALEKDGSEL